MSIIELTAVDAEWARDLDAADRTYRTLTRAWAAPTARLGLVRDGEHGHVVGTAPTVHTAEGPIYTHHYNDLDQLVEAGWRLDDE